MLLVIATCHKDYAQTVELVRWIGEIGVYPKHRALIVGSSLLSITQIQDLVDMLKVAGFNGVQAIRAREEDSRGWPYAPNQMFKLAVQFVQEQARCPFLWLEPDATPMRGGWLDDIEVEYRTAGHPYMGAKFDKPWPHLNGNAVYPANLTQYNPHTLNVNGGPFDTIRADLTMAKTHWTPLIFHEWGDVQRNIPVTFHDVQSIERIPKSAVIFHRCKDGTLIQRLREAANQVYYRPSLLEAAKTGCRRLLRGWSTYYHSGNLGDIVYGLYAIKKDGGGTIIIGPKQNHTSPCAVPITRPQYDLLKPLLDCQPYLRGVSFSDEYPKGKGVMDLNKFRNHWNHWHLRQKMEIHTLAKAHFYTLGIIHRFHHNEVWITAPTALMAEKIIVHRSSRYNSQGFPWKEISDRYHKDLLFVGLDTEHRAFEQLVGKKVSFYRVRDFLELAQVIDGGKAYIGNQSFGLSLAIGLGKTVFCEEWEPSPDCRFERDNFCSQLTGDVMKRMEEIL